MANFNRKEHLRHRAVSLRQHGFLVETINTTIASITESGKLFQVQVTLNAAERSRIDLRFDLLSHVSIALSVRHLLSATGLHRFSCTDL